MATLSPPQPTFRSGLTQSRDLTQSRGLTRRRDLTIALGAVMILSGLAVMTFPLFGVVWVVGMLAGISIALSGWTHLMVPVSLNGRTA